MRIHPSIVAAGFVVGASLETAHANLQGLTQVVTGVGAPMFATTAPGDPNRLFIAQRNGDIRVFHLDTGVLEATPFLSIPNVDAGGEGGLLGLAFHPNYANVGSVGFGKFYVNVTVDNGGDTSLGLVSPFSNYIREYTVTANPNLASLASEKQILSFVQPQENHNGGWIGFSPIDRNLYIATGDGGAGNDDGGGHTPGTGNAQDVTNQPLGKMLRIDVNGDDFTGAADPTNSRNYAIPPTNPFKAGVGTVTDDGGDDEIWAYGLRNPFRDSFDRVTGDLWIGDVGQGAREEIDFQPANSAGGENYGWRLREGLIQTPAVGGAKPPGNVDPVYDYDRDADQFGGTVVSGGYLYRGPDPSLQGKYFFLDSRNSSSITDDNYWMFDPADPFGTVDNIDASLTPNIAGTQWPVSFGEDSLGNLYILYLVSGTVYRIQASSGTAGFWNANANGNWSAAANWTGTAPNAIDASGTFGPAISAPRTITVDSPRTLGVLYFNSPISYTLGGNSTITLDASAGLAGINVLDGNHTITAPIVLNDSVLINVVRFGSTLTLSGELTATGQTIHKLGVGAVDLQNIRAAGVRVLDGTVRVLAKGTPNDPSGTSVVSSYLVVPYAHFDLTNNSMIVDYTGSPGTLVDDTRKNLLAGRLLSSSATALTGLGYGDNALLAQTTFAGQPVDADSLLIKFTYFGDGDLDGDVDVNDLGILASAWQTTGVWTNGDFDYNGSIDVNDLGLLASNWQAGVGSPLGPHSLADALSALGLSSASVPEPAALVSLSALACLRRRRRR
jgi:glucose/arabinose dehydrogenase